jgi:hypothetical protein
MGQTKTDIKPLHSYCREQSPAELWQVTTDLDGDVTTTELTGSEWRDLVSTSDTPSAFDSKASEHCGAHYDDTTDADPALSAEENATNAKDAWRQALYNVRAPG